MRRLAIRKLDMIDMRHVDLKDAARNALCAAHYRAVWVVLMDEYEYAELVLAGSVEPGLWPYTTTYERNYNRWVCRGRTCPAAGTLPT